VQRHESDEERLARPSGWKPTLQRLACVAAVALASSASATDVEASVTGLMQARPTVVSGEQQTFLPFVAVLGLRVTEQRAWIFDELRAEFGAWGRLSVLDLGNSAADVDVASISVRLLDRRLGLNLGRQFVSGGAARALQLDGASAEVLLPAGFGLSGFMGVPVIPRFALARGDAVGGARAFWRHGWETEIGASYFELRDGGLVGRRDLGLDFRTLLFTRLAVSGLGVFSLLETRFAELGLTAKLALGDTVDLTGAFRRSSPDLFLPRSSIFSTFAETNRTEGSLAVDWTPVRAWSFGVDGRVIGFDDGLGYEVQGQVGFRPGRGTRSSLQVIRLADPTNAYTRARIAVRQTVGNVTLSADVDGALFDNPINGRTTALQGQLTAKLALPANFDVLVSGLAATDPLFVQRFELLARVVYTFKLHTTGEAR
jgi:hypothetical protein